MGRHSPMSVSLSQMATASSVRSVRFVRGVPSLLTDPFLLLLNRFMARVTGLAQSSCLGALEDGRAKPVNLIFLPQVFLLMSVRPSRETHRPVAHLAHPHPFPLTHSRPLTGFRFPISSFSFRPLPSARCPSSLGPGLSPSAFRIQPFFPFQGRQAASSIPLFSPNA
jgi:hypothetical protein